MAAGSVYLEVGKQRTFAAAVDWPGWCRSGKTEDLALQELATYASRYQAVATEAKLALPNHFEIVERLAGSATTDFGAPAGIPECDLVPTTAGQAQRITSLVTASWELLDRIAHASPADLRKGPRGGGRDRDQMLDHVLVAEAAYARKIGVNLKSPSFDDGSGIAALRRAITLALSRPSPGGPPAAKGWPARYAARRIAWHVLDHAWEMEDRA